MGKTNRKVKWYAGKSREFYIKEQIDRDYARNLIRGFVWVKLTKEERHEEYLKEKPRYDREMVEYNIKMQIANERLAYFREHYAREPFMFETVCQSVVEFPRKPYIHISKTKIVPFEDDYDTFFEKRYDEESRRYDKMMRDGKVCETSRSTGFKQEVNRKRRSHDRKVLKCIMKDEEYYYDSCFYGNKDGKKLVWNWW